MNVLSFFSKYAFAASLTNNKVSFSYHNMGSVAGNDACFCIAYGVTISVEIAVYKHTVHREVQMLTTVMLITAAVIVVVSLGYGLKQEFRARKAPTSTTQQNNDAQGEGPYRSTPVLHYPESDVEEQNRHALQTVGVPLDILIPVGFQKTLYTAHVTMAWKFDQVLYENKVLVQTRLGNYVTLKYDKGKWVGETETKSQAAVELLKQGFELPEDLCEAAMENLV